MKTPAEPFYHPILTAIGGRKFLALMVVLVSATALLIGGYLPPSSYERIVMVIAGTYITGDAIASLAHRKRSAGELEGELGNNPSTDFSTR